jgi:hypothetical protein
MFTQSTISNLQFIISCLYFFLPAYFANMTPPIAKRLGIFKSLAKPIDFDKKFFGKPIFGSHKTWRGAILAFFVGFLTALIQGFFIISSFSKNYRLSITQKSTFSFLPF